MIPQFYFIENGAVRRMDYLIATRQELSDLFNALKETLDRYEIMGLDDETIKFKNSIVNEQFQKCGANHMEKTDEMVNGIIYFIRAEVTGFTKIGMTTRLIWDRFAEIKKVYPSAHLVAHYAVQEPKKVERALHKKYKHVRMYGEWFNLTYEQIMEEVKNNG